MSLPEAKQLIEGAGCDVLEKGMKGMVGLPYPAAHNVSYFVITIINLILSNAHIFTLNWCCDGHIMCLSLLCYNINHSECCPCCYFEREK